jgi:light-regulated signal transduction histidine kinase (bacteriophytochrome)/DNA-binding NarL/FixJ family response regulator
VSDQPELTDQPDSTEALDISICHKEPVHIPNRIQPHGVLLVLDASSLTIIQVSDNTLAHLGRPPDDLLNQSIETLIDPSVMVYLREAVREERLNIYPLHLFTIEIAGQQHPFDGIAHALNGLVLLELEPVSHTSAGYADPYRTVKMALGRLLASPSLQSFFEETVAYVRQMTGFDRVMLYRFQEDSSGDVVAEACRDDLSPFLGLRYPASDIPEQARALYLRNWLRLIPDVAYTPSPMVPDYNPQTGNFLDMSYTVLRSVSPYHIEYLINMGVRASMSISLILNDKLWGMIACHQYSGPRHVPYDIRTACEFMGIVFSSLLPSKETSETYEHTLNLKSALVRFVAQMSNIETTEELIRELLTFSPSLPDILQAEGVAFLLDGNYHAIGKTPPTEALSDLAGWFTSRQNGNGNGTSPKVFSTNQLCAHWPRASELKESATGLMAASLPRNRNEFIFWFRPEVVHTVSWGGNPNKPIEVSEDGKRVSPRKSFEAWKETVRDMARPWIPSEVEAAREIVEGLAIARDNIERQRVARSLQEARDAAEAANRAKSTFLANMSHELRTPLNAILGFTQLMARDTTLSPEHLENLRIVGRSGEHLLSLINDVLEMSKIEAGRSTLYEYTFNLHSLLQDMADMFQLRAEDKGLQLLIEKDPNLPPYIYADESKLRQVLINLLSNAIKFTWEGGVTLRARRQIDREVKEQGHAAQEIGNAVSGVAPTCWLQFEVEDTGVGIAAHEVSTLFETFTQTSSGQEAREGTGLGLALSRQFVRLMQGDITVKSAPGYGSTFAFDVQVSLSEPEDAPATAPARRVVGLATGQQTYRVLIAEDRWDNRKLLIKLLEQVGFEVQSAPNGQEAVTIWESWNPHLILMDMRMPVMDGYEATRQIKGTTRGHATAIVALTASVFEEERAIVISAGCDDLIRKPFRHADIFDVLIKHLGVRFVYEEQTTGKIGEEASSSALTTDALKALPSELVSELHHASRIGNVKLIINLIERIREQNEAMAEELMYLVDLFRFEQIAAMTGALGDVDKSDQSRKQ